MKVEKVIISKQGETSSNYETFKKIVKEKKIEVLVVKKGDCISIDRNVTLQILWPKKEQIKENILNNNSIVAKLNYNNFSILLTGDIEEIAENQILQEYKNTNTLQATILKVAHHGSKTSSTQTFLEAVKPKIALIGVGAKNTFGHPNSGTLEKLQNLNCKIYRTDENGEVSIEVNSKGGIKVKKFIE
jgi:competence protein ComEC